MILDMENSKLGENLTAQQLRAIHAFQKQHPHSGISRTQLEKSFARDNRNKEDFERLRQRANKAGLSVEQYVAQGGF